MNPRVRSVEPLEDFLLKITFTNKETRVYDCTPLLGFGVFKELKKPAYFRKVKAVGGTAVWPHEQDICPDTLYQCSKELHSMVASPSKRFGRRSKRK